MPHAIARMHSSQNDAFGRVRVSQPETIFDSKMLHDAAPLFWDDQETSGGGTGSTHNPDRASVIMDVSATTAGVRTRQTFQRFNYQPGKSQLIFLTAVIAPEGGQVGITRRMGYFSGENGLYFELTGDVLSVGKRSHVTGSTVDTLVNQADWNIDTMDGTGNSAVTLDLTQSQIMVIDFEWLGVGSVRYGWVVNGAIIYCHQTNHANILNSVYMSTPNNPMRYEIENDGTGAAATLEHICSTVISEGGSQKTGALHYASTNGTHVDANVVGTLYAIVGLKLQANYKDDTVDIEGISLLAETNDNFEWILLLNPTVAGTFTYGNLANSAVQVARGATANTVTGGTPLTGGWIASNGTDTLEVPNARRLGAAIDDTLDTIVLCARPLSANADIQGSITMRQIS